MVHAGLFRQPAQLKLLGLSLEREKFLFLSNNLLVAQAPTAIWAAVAGGTSGPGNI